MSIQSFNRREMLKIGALGSAAAFLNFNLDAGDSVQARTPVKLAKFNLQIYSADNAPLESDWARITIGTREEMEIFADAMRRTLRA